MNNKKEKNIVNFVFEQSPEDIFLIGLFSNMIYFTIPFIFYGVGYIPLLGLKIFLIIYFGVGIGFFHLTGVKRGFDDKFLMVLVFVVLTLLGFGLVITLLLWKYFLSPIVEKIRKMDVPKMYQKNGDEN